METITFYLAWAKIEEKQLALPYEAHQKLEESFVDLYTHIFKFLARAARTLQNKTRMSTRCNDEPALTR